MTRRRDRATDFLKRNRRWFKAADEVLKTLFAARGGGPVAHGLAAFTSIGVLSDALFPTDSGWDTMMNLGLAPSSMRVGGFLCELLMESNVPRRTVFRSMSSEGSVWMDPSGEPFAGALYFGSKFDYGPFLSMDGQDTLYEAVQQVVWSRSSELMLTTLRSAESTYRGAGRFHLEPLTPLGKYIGKRQPEWYARRISKYPAGPRTIVLRGPTGVGKSVLARHISKRLGGRDARTLKISSKALRGCSSDELLAVTEALQPTVLLLDDLDLSETANNESLLAMLESLRDPNCLVIVTMMTPPTHKEKEPKPGSWHFPGMRPGRADGIFTLYLPDKGEREEMLGAYADEHGLRIKKSLRKKLVKATHGLSGAYIMRVVEELATHGVGNWREEVNMVLYTAPFPDGEKEGEAEGKDAPATPATT